MAKRTKKSVTPPVTPTTEPIDVQSLAGVGRLSDRWPLGSEWSPRRIAAAVKNAPEDSTEYLTLALDCSERSLAYASAMQTRTLAVVGQDLEVQSGDGSKAGQDIADLYRKHVVETEAYHEALVDLLQMALNVSYSVVQPVWCTTSSKLWTYREFVHQDPRLFMFEKEMMRTLRIKSQNNPDGIEIPEGELVIHTPKIRSGIQIRGGLARSAVVAYMFSAQGQRAWSQYCELYGVPLRLLKYDPNLMGPAERAKARTLIVSIANDAAGMIPEGMDIDIKDISRGSGSGSKVFESLTSYWDSMIYRLVLGGNLTSESGSGSYSQAVVHRQVQTDIARADARSLFATERAQIAEPWTRYNFGPNAPVPITTADVEEPEDLETFSKALAPMIERGLKVSATEIRERFGLREVTDEADVITPWASPLTAPGGVPPTPVPPKTK